MTRYFFDPADLKELRLSRDVLSGMPMPADWGRCVVVQDAWLLRVKELTGEVIGEVRCDVYLDGCVLCKERYLLLFWGGKMSSMYACCLADLRRGKMWAVYETQAASGTPRAVIVASFAHGEPEVVRVSTNFEVCSVTFDGHILNEGPSEFEMAEESPNGQLRAGSQRDGILGLIDRNSPGVVSTGIQSIGRTQWDPSSRYVLTERLTHSMPWNAQQEIVVIDAVTREYVTLPAIAGDPPFPRMHRYDWVLLPPHPQSNPG